MKVVGWKVRVALLLGLVAGTGACRQEASEASVEVEGLVERTARQAGASPSGARGSREGVETGAATTGRGSGARGSVLRRSAVSAVEVQGSSGRGPGAEARRGTGDDDWVWEPPGRKAKGRGGRPRPPSIGIESCERYGRLACRCRDPRRGEALCAGAVEVIRTWKRMLEVPEETPLDESERRQGGSRGLDPARKAIEEQAEAACREGLREVRRLCQEGDVEAD